MYATGRVEPGDSTLRSKLLIATIILILTVEEEANHLRFTRLKNIPSMDVIFHTSRGRLHQSPACSVSNLRPAGGGYLHRRQSRVSHATNGDMDPCWTCRNRRVQCDRSRSPCAKCIKAGVECFDKRPLRWVKGVAIRGNMQGYSYEGKHNTPRKASGLATKARSKQSEGALVRSSADSRLPTALQDPTVLNMDRISRYYIDYCKLLIPLDELLRG